MPTKEQVAAIAKLIGQQTAEKFVLNHDLIEAHNSLETRHKADMAALYKHLGLPIPGAPVARDEGENSPPGLSRALPPGISPGMTAADIPPEMLGGVLPDVAPGQVIDIPPPPLPNVPAGATNIPRPLKDRK
jgi:hypothetical protein